jgi:hypothetical protein
MCCLVAPSGCHICLLGWSLQPLQEAYARRGAPWTFDAQAFVDAIRCIKQQGRVLLPSFDHGVGDPVEGDILIDAAQHGVVLVSLSCWQQRAMCTAYTL